MFWFTQVTQSKFWMKRKHRKLSDFGAKFWKRKLSSCETKKPRNAYA